MTLEELTDLKRKSARPVIVTHIGSASKCQKRFEEMLLSDTLAFKRVWSIGCNTHDDKELARMGYRIDKTELDILHLYKIDDSDEVLVLDITDLGQKYLGESTTRELDYAWLMGKKVRFYSKEVPIEVRVIYDDEEEEE